MIRTITLGSGRLRSLAFCTLSACVLVTAICVSAAAQETPAVATAVNQPYTFRTDVNQILVRVVVHDGRGQTVSGLKQDDFAIFDNGKPRPIVFFSESHGNVLQTKTEGARAHPADQAGPQSTPVPTTFTIYLFDDMHMKTEELSRARSAVDVQVQHLNQHSSQRIAIFSTSGKIRQAFTSDPSSIRAALSNLRAQERKLEDESSCPYMNYYMARRLKTDSDAKATIITETMRCLNVATKPKTPDERCSAIPQISEEPAGCEIARQAVDAEMQRLLVGGELDGWTILSALDGALRQLVNVAGERKIVLVSPGFTVEPHAVEVRMDQALQAGITIDVIDARGLYLDPLYDVAQSRFSQRITPFIRDSEKARADALTQITDGSGGRLYNNTNDLGKALERAADIPESSYLLAFSPQQFKKNGSFHQIKVKLASGLNYEISARKGYFESGKRSAAEQQRAQTLAEIFFSQEQRRDIPVDVTVYFGSSNSGDDHLDLGKPNSDGTFATVIATRIGVQSLHYRPDKDRLANVLTEVCGVFDKNGNFLTAVQNTSTLRLTRAQLSRLTNGITVKSSFKLKAGSYVMRFVLQDQQGHMVTARSMVVEIR